MRCSLTVVPSSGYSFGTVSGTHCPSFRWGYAPTHSEMIGCTNLYWVVSFLYARCIAREEARTLCSEPGSCLKGFDFRLLYFGWPLWIRTSSLFALPTALLVMSLRTSRCRQSDHSWAFVRIGERTILASSLEGHSHLHLSHCSFCFLYQYWSWFQVEAKLMATSRFQQYHLEYRKALIASRSFETDQVLLKTNFVCWVPKSE